MTVDVVGYIHTDEVKHLFSSKTYNVKPRATLYKVYLYDNDLNITKSKESITLRDIKKNIFRDLKNSYIKPDGKLHYITPKKKKEKNYNFDYYKIEVIKNGDYNGTK